MIPLPLQPKIVKKEKNKATFEIDALYPGYGATIGNSLRRVLLSSLEGAAITQMKIKGVPHEFSTIPGVMEDVVTIMLNLKQMRFRVLNNDPQKATLKIKGEKEVKASDFEFPSQVELISKDCHVATLTQKNAELEMEIQIEKGIGYSPRESRKKPTVPKQEKLEIGQISVDAIFTPVKRVSFYVENMRVGERTDFDKLFLEIETDGTILPETAFFETSETLVKHFALFAESVKPAEIIPQKTEEKIVPVAAKKRKKQALKEKKLPTGQAKKKKKKS